jgi:alkyl hydroperoxide reductase subunit AhpF
MAFASAKIVGDMIDATTYQQLSDKYRITGVPASFFNGRLSQLGAAPEARIRDLVRQADRLTGTA